MFKRLAIVSSFLLLIGCGSSTTSQYTNSNQGNDAIETTKQILQAGITVDPVALINSTWTAYNIIPGSSIALYSRTIQFNNGEIRVVGFPKAGTNDSQTITFDLVKDKFSGFTIFSFLNLGRGEILSEKIKTAKKTCEDDGFELFATSVPEGALIYSDLFDVTASYEIVKENGVSNLKITISGKNFRDCCETLPGQTPDQCSGVDFTGPIVQRISKYLIVAATQNGFILESYNDKGNVVENNLLSFIK